MAMELLDTKLKSGNHVLEGVGYGGGPAARTLPAIITKRLGKSGTQPHQGYGATELSSACANVLGEDFVDRMTILSHQSVSQRRLGHSLFWHLDRPRIYWTRLPGERYQDRQ
jgi:acyl-CoA synthetase (AMP-forming)/AMP-acid ligase II